MPSSDDGARERLLADPQQQRQQHEGYGGVEDNNDRAAAAAAETGAERGTTFKRNLGAVEAFGIVISIVIGSGVFTSPGSIDTNVPSPGMALAVWLVGGVLAWTGATTLAELGTAIPGEGGVQRYLEFIFGDVYGFLAAWTWVVAVMPATLAILSIVFVESIFSAAGITDQAGRIEHKLLSVLTLIVISVANSISTKASTRLNNFFVVTKFVAISAVVVAGIAVVAIQVSSPERRDVGGRDWFTRPWFGYRNILRPDGSEVDWHELSGWEILGHYSAALYGALWAYSGWDKAVYISAELSEPARQLPLSINSALPVIILCFIASNVAYYILLPWNVVSTTDSVAVTAITRLLGPVFGIISAILICLVVAGSLLGNSFVAGRMAVAAANKGWLPGVFSRLGINKNALGRAASETSISSPPSPAGGGGPSSNAEEATTTTTTKSPAAATSSDAPINAIVLSTVLSTLYILFGSFRALLTLNGLGEYSFFLLTVLGAMVLRHRDPNLARPYRPSVLVPAIFAVVSGFVVVRGAIFAPAQAIILVLVWTLGLLFYWARLRWAGRRAH